MAVRKVVTTMEFYDVECDDPPQARGGGREAAPPRTLVAEVALDTIRTYPYPGLEEARLADLDWHLMVARSQGFTGTWQELSACLGDGVAKGGTP